MTKAWEAEVLRLHMRFVTEVIEGGDFCPWARGARLQGAVDVRVCLDEDLASAARSYQAIEALDVIQIVVPDATDSALRWRERVTLLERSLRSAAPSWPYACAAFHPEHPGRPESLGGAIGLLRRSPFPMVQLVRLSALDELRARIPARVDALPAQNQAALMEQWAEHYGPIVEALIAEGTPLRRGEGREPA